MKTWARIKVKGSSKRLKAEAANVLHPKTLQPDKLRRSYMEDKFNTGKTRYLDAEGNELKEDDLFELQENLIEGQGTMAEEDLDS